jgi:hypothetical protein
MKKKTSSVFAAIALFAFAGAGVLCGQTAPTPATPPATPPATRPASAGGIVQGTVKDSTGAVIPNATITVLDGTNTIATGTTKPDGTFTLRGVAPGTYSLTVTRSGLQQASPMLIQVAIGQPATANVTMVPQAEKQEVTVNESADNKISVDPSNNATALVLKDADLDALPDDPDDLEADLTALAGPSGGPSGPQIYVDGFTGGSLPPKASIREIRINSNPFSSEFDKLGYGRIQIFTKPGSDKFHGQGYYSISDGIWNSRNPFLTYNPSFKTQLYGGNLSGPITKKSSFFVDFERRDINDNGIITATIPTSNLLGTTSFQSSVPTPQTRFTVSPRVDWQVSTNNTLSMRYNYVSNDHQVAGIGAFDLGTIQFGGLSYGSNGNKQNTNNQSAQIVETAVISPQVVNETHFEYSRNYADSTSLSDTPELSVSQSFVAGGSGYSTPGYPSNTDRQNYYEFQNYTSVTWGTHTTKIGIRSRTTLITDFGAGCTVSANSGNASCTPLSFNGNYQFLGGTDLSSIQQYLTTVRLLDAGYSSAQVTAMGYGPSKYTVNSGNPSFNLQQTDLGPFINDDWRVRPNLTMSFGLRFETQDDIPDRSDWAPRFGFAWQPGGSKSKLVIRGGWGMFYDRFAVASVEEAERYSSGNNITTYTQNDPTLYNAAFNTQIPLTYLSTTGNTAQKYQIDSNLRSPYLMQTAIGAERQLFAHTTLNVNYLNARGNHELRTVDINAPIPVVGALPPGAGNVASAAICCRPYAFDGDIYDYQSTGTFKQNQLLINSNSSVGRWLTLFARYSISRAYSDTDGLGSLPNDPYNLKLDWGRSSSNVNNTFFLGGSLAAKWGIRLSPFVILRSGVPYNITTGTDLYLQDSGSPTARPGVSETALAGYVYEPRLGLYLNPDPAVGSAIIARNSETGPGNISINLRVSRTWGFGTTKFEGPSGGARAGGGGGRGGPGGGGPGGRGETTNHRYNLTLSVSARNAINHENLNTPNGSMTSPYFAESTGISGGFGAEATASNQRRMDIQLRFAF